MCSVLVGRAPLVGEIIVPADPTAVRMGCPSVEGTDMNRSQRRRLRTRAALLASMRTELATSSVEEMVVHDVTERADVALGTFYNHFDDKSAGVHALAELEAALMRRLMAETVGGSTDLVRHACSVATLTVHRAAADPAWIKAVCALVDAQMWPTPNGRRFVTDVISATSPMSTNEIAWTVEVFHSITRGLVRHLARDGFEGPLDERIATVVASMCGALLVDEATCARHVEFCQAIPVRTEWPDAAQELVDDEDFVVELRRTGAVSAGVLDD